MVGLGLTSLQIFSEELAMKAKKSLYNIEHDSISSATESCFEIFYTYVMMV